MIEDKLTRDERLRLEALAQSNMRWQMKPADDEQIIATARKFERFLLDANHEGEEQ